MNTQKFKRGNLVKVLVGQEIYSSEAKGKIEISPEYVGKEAVIEYSYAEKYGGGNIKDYSIVFCETGTSMAWKTEHELEFIDEGGEYLLEAAKTKRKELRKKSTDLKYLSESIEGNLNSDSILYLFDLLNYKSKFLVNGEYWILFDDWALIKPYLIFIKEAKSWDEVKETFPEDYLKEYNIEKVYNAFKTVQLK